MIFVQHFSHCSWISRSTRCSEGILWHVMMLFILKMVSIILLLSSNYVHSSIIFYKKLHPCCNGRINILCEVSFVALKKTQNKVVLVGVVAVGVFMKHGFVIVINAYLNISCMWEECDLELGQYCTAPSPCTLRIKLNYSSQWHSVWSTIPSAHYPALL